MAYDGIFAVQCIDEQRHCFLGAKAKFAEAPDGLSTNLRIAILEAEDESWQEDFRSNHSSGTCFWGGALTQD